MNAVLKMSEPKCMLLLGFQDDGGDNGTKHYGEYEAEFRHLGYPKSASTQKEVGKDCLDHHLALSLVVVILPFGGKPTFMKAPEDQIGISGGVASFVCQATGEPKPRITWMKKGKKVSSQRFEVIEFDDGSGSVLRIQPLRVHRDEAIYECTATNSVGEINTSAKLTVLEASWEFVMESVSGCSTAAALISERSACSSSWPFFRDPLCSAGKVEKLLLALDIACFMVLSILSMLAALGAVVHSHITPVSQALLARPALAFP
ncbi:hypothetical protein Q9233_001505 [Columba guinea]|nr:hypothetical protein Q9233_001505 [Columba guinea]